MERLVESGLELIVRLDLLKYFAAGTMSQYLQF